MSVCRWFWNYVCCYYPLWSIAILESTPGFDLIIENHRFEKNMAENFYDWKVYKAELNERELVNAIGLFNVSFFKISTKM